MEAIELIMKRLIINSEFTRSAWHRLKALDFTEQEVTDHSSLITVVGNVKGWNVRKMNNLRKEEKKLYKLPAKIINDGTEIWIKTSQQEEKLTKLPEYWPDLKKLYDRLDDAAYHRLYNQLKNWYQEGEKMKIIMADDGEINGETPQEIVEKLAARDASNPKNITDYMERVADRMSLINQEVDISTPEKFLISLVEVGLATEYTGT